LQAVFLCIPCINQQKQLWYSDFMNLQKINVVFLGILVIIGLGFVLDFSQPVVLPLVIAFLLLIIFEPVVNRLTKFNIPRAVGVVIVVVILLGVCVLIGFFFFTSIQSFVKEYPKYIARLNNIINDIAARLPGRLPFRQDPFTNIDWAKYLQTDKIFSFTGDFTNFLGKVFIILVILIFLFFEIPHFKGKLSKAFPLHTSRRIGIILEHITRQVARYLGVKTFISFMTGVSVWLCLTIIGMDFPLIWGAIAFFFNFIPNIGSAIVVALTLLMGFIQFYPSVGRIVAVGATMFGVQLVWGNFLDPKLQGNQLNLSPVIIIASLVYWGWLWGIVGALISVPIAATIKIICENIPYLKPVGVLMGSGKMKKRRKRKKY